MAWIETIDENEAGEELYNVYKELKRKRGKISNILKVQSLLPKTMKDHLELYTHIMFNASKLSREDKELIAVVVSKLNNCSYCINHHAEALYCYWRDEKKIKDFLDTLEPSLLTLKQQAIITYAEKLTLHPDEIKEMDINYLRKNSLTDKEILETALITSYFNFVNRIALGLHVSFTEEELKGYKY